METRFYAGFFYLMLPDNWGISYLSVEIIYNDCVEFYQKSPKNAEVLVQARGLLCDDVLENIQKQ